MPTTQIQSGPASAGSPFAVIANAHIDKNRGLILRKFPEYEIDATQLLYSDTYVQYDELMVQTLNGDYINLGNYVKKVEFNDYYPSILTEKEFREKIASYYTKKESNELLQNIRDNYTTNVSFNNFIETQKETDRQINAKIDSNLGKINTINNNVIPTLKTKDSFNEDIAKYTNTEELNRILATYTNTANMDTKLQAIRDTHNTYKTANDARSLNIETTIADMYNKKYINDTFALYYTRKENDVRYNTLDRKIKTNTDELVNVNNNISILYRDKADNTSFTEFKEDSYRRAEIDKKIADVNAYTKPEINNIVSGLNTDISNANARISDTNTRMGNMYSNIFHDTRYNNLDYRVKTNFNAIEDIKVQYVTLINYKNEIKKINDALDIRHTKTEINNIIYNNNLNYYTKREIDSKSNDDIVKYDKENKKYIASQIAENNKSYLALVDFNIYKDTVFTKTEITNLFVNKLADYDLSTVVDTKINNSYSKTKNEYTNLLNTTLDNYYNKSHIDNEFSKYRTKEDDNAYISNTLESYVTKEKFARDLTNIPTIQNMTDTIYSKLDENNKRLDDVIGNHVDKKMLIFYDYLLNNSGIYYSKQTMDLKLQGKEDKSISILRFSHLENRIEKFYKKFITYYTKDEIDSKFTYYFSNVNIADATLYYTSVETDRLLNEKVDKATYNLFYNDTYNKSYVDTELGKKVNTITYNSEISDLHDNDTKLKTALDNLTTFINGDFTNNINSRFTSVEDNLNGKITTNINDISSINTKVNDLTELSKTFKNEAQINTLIKTVTDGKVSKSDYDLDKLTFVKTTDFELIKNKLENDYTKSVDMNKTISDVRNSIPSDTKINSLIDNKLGRYTSSSDLLTLVDDKITNKANTLKNTITNETDEKFTKYPTLTFLSQNNYTKDEADTKRNELKQTLTTEINSVKNTLSTYKTYVNDNYLKLTGGTVTGNLTVNNTFRVGDYSLSNDGFKFINNTKEYLLFNVEDVVTGGSARQKGILVGSNTIDYVRFTSVNDLYHNKYNADNSTYNIYKIITEETFTPFKDSIYTKVEANKLLKDKVDKTTFDQTVNTLNTNLSTKHELTEYKEEMTATLEHYHTIEKYQKYLEDNYTKGTDFDVFKNTTNAKIENDLKTKLDELKQDTKTKLDDLTTQLETNVITVNTDISGKIKTLEDNTYKKTEVNDKLDLKADKSSVQGVLYENKNQYDKSLNIGNINIKTDNTVKDSYYVFNKFGIQFNNKTDSITRDVFNVNISSDNKYNINIGSESVDDVKLIAKNLTLVDKTNNTTSPIATKSMIESTKSTIENNMNTKVLELQGNITTLNTKTGTNTQNITELFKEIAKKSDNTNIINKLDEKLDKSGGSITGIINMDTDNSTIKLNSPTPLTVRTEKLTFASQDAQGEDYILTASDIPVFKFLKEKIADATNHSDSYRYTVDGSPISKAYYTYNDLFLFGDFNYTLDQSVLTITNLKTEVKSNGEKVSPYPDRIYMGASELYVVDRTNDYKPDKVVSMSAFKNLETSIKKYVDEKVDEKLNEIARILDKINGV